MITPRAEFNNGTANNYLSCNLLDGATNVQNFDWGAGDVDGWYDQNQSEVIPLTIAAAGTKTYSLTCATNSGTASGTYGQIFVNFFGATLP